MAVSQLFVNINAPSVTQGLVRSLTDNTPVTFPELVLNDSRTYQLFFVDGQGNYATWSGANSYTPFLAFGGCGNSTGGTFTISYGGYTTAGQAYNVALATLQTALQGLTSIGSNNVTVTGVPGEYYFLTFVGALAAQPITQVTGSALNLTPTSNLNISTLVAGTVSPAVNCVQMVIPTLNPVVLVDVWSQITNGWSAAITANSVSLLQAIFAAGGATLSDTLQITVQDSSSNMNTYVQIAATAICSIVNLNAYASATSPAFVTQSQLTAAVLGLNNFTRTDTTISAAGNTNITPASTSRNTTAHLTFSGAAGNYTVCALATNSPQLGDQMIIAMTMPATAGIIVKVYALTTGGTLLATITSDGSARPYFVLLGYNAVPAWDVSFDSSLLMNPASNLAGLANTTTAKSNLNSLFGRIVTKSANYSIVAADEGTLFSCSASGGAFTLTLPTASSLTSGWAVAFQKSDSSALTVVTSPATATAQQQGQLIVVQSNGSSWNVVINSGLNTFPISTGVTVINNGTISGTGALIQESLTSPSGVSLNIGTNTFGTAVTINSATGQINIQANIATNNVLGGSLVVPGDIGIAGNVYAGNVVINSVSTAGALAISNVGLISGQASFYAGYLTGTGYTLSNVSNVVTGGTTSPNVTLNTAGTYIISGAIVSEFVGATFAGNQTLAAAFRRTNNTPANLANGNVTSEIPIITTTTTFGPSPAIPSVIYTTANTTDTIGLYANLSANASAGNVVLNQGTWIIAERVY